MKQYEPPRITREANIPTVEYRVVDDNELLRLGMREASRWSNDHYWAVVRYEDGEPKELIGQDGDAPEDQTLVRDWDWVPQALADAYKLGMKNGLRAVMEGTLDDTPKT